MSIDNYLSLNAGLHRPASIVDYHKVLNIFEIRARLLWPDFSV
ncbi:MAG: hypothetical protein K0S24_2171 [Sphingobacterium sp.]|jgi:hypothetical protein|nr:hypothetical protein [Sphingobacterium sp.]